MRISEKGQVTVPIEIRRKMGMLPDTEVEFVVAGKDVVLRKVPGQRGTGSRLISSMRGKARQRLTTDQIMALTRGE
jgi:AbrB family looped-hinge helix DNA binding protein